MHVSINIVSWNDRRYLPELFAAIRSQTHKDYTVRILDNGNPDGEALQFIMQNEPHWLAVRNTKNVGFAAGQNQLLRIAFDRYTGDVADHAVLIANSDMDWNPMMLEKLVRALEEHPEIDVVQPKVFRAYSERGDVEGDAVKSDILDSTGIVVQKGWRFADRGAGEMDKGQYDNAVDIFGPSGTISLIRASAILNVMIGEEFFDADFFSYGEDKDLAWRLHNAGHKTLFVPSARAHHYRGMFGTEHRTLKQRFQDRKLRRPSVVALSTRNALFVLLKNCSFREAFKNLPWIFFYQGKRILFGIFFEKETRRVLLRAPLLIPRMFRKRFMIHYPHVS